LENIYYYNPRVISFYSGIALDMVKICMKQLEDMGFLAIKDNYYMLLKGHQAAKRGKFTQNRIDEERKKIPVQTLEYFDSILEKISDPITGVESEEIDDNYTGVAPEHNNNINIKTNNKDNINKNINKINKKKYNEKDVELTKLLFAKMQENTPHRKLRPPKDDDYEHINKLNRLDGAPYELIQAVIEWSQQDEFWTPNIRSTYKLREHYDKLELQARKYYNDRQSKRTVVL